MWIKPATNSLPFRFKADSKNALSRDIHPVNQLAPHPSASAAFKSAKQTAPADKCCSMSGILSVAFGVETTAKIKGGNAYSRKAGVRHNVINSSNKIMTFIEIELKSSS